MSVFVCAVRERKNKKKKDGFNCFFFDFIRNNARVARLFVFVDWLNVVDETRGPQAAPGLYSRHRLTF